MKRTIHLLLGVVALALPLALSTSSAASTSRAAAGSDGRAFCEVRAGTCPDTLKRTNYEGEYVGHDEPALNFYSNRAGSGNSADYRLRLPNEPVVPPNQSGTGGTWNFQQRIAFWLGMDLCETQSYPNPGKPCPADSDSNIKDGSNPSSPDWIGNHVGTGFLELQFYPPGWTPFIVGPSCTPTKWCAAMAVFGLSDSLSETNNLDCLQRAGEEWANFAFLTKSGKPQAPPDPLGQTDQSFIPSDPSKVLFMSGGDELAISIHDSAAGLVTQVSDLTNGQKASMTASAANGFAHPLFQPNASTCTEEPYSFHPMYSTSSEHTRVPWAAHSYNVSFSDEIGHFEYCDRSVNGVCVDPGANDPVLDDDDVNCFNPSDSMNIKIGGCIGEDLDFDGTSYLPDWPGSLANATQDHLLHSESVLFTSPLSNGRNYERMAFEADLPAIELTCDTTTGAGCVNPPPGAQFYPIYTTRGGSSCAWQQGGTHIPGTTNTFGGSSKTEYGPLLGLNYPDGIFFEDFRNVMSTNPCPTSGQLPH